MLLDFSVQVTLMIVRSSRRVWSHTCAILEPTVLFGYVTGYKFLLRECFFRGLVGRFHGRQHSIHTLGMDRVFRRNYELWSSYTYAKLLRPSWTILTNPLPGVAGLLFLFDSSLLPPQTNFRGYTWLS